MKLLSNRTQRCAFTIVICLVFCFLCLFACVQEIERYYNSEESLIATSYSPEKTYLLTAYRVDTNATVDFSVKVYAAKNWERKLIYNAYHESEVRIEWIEEDVVSINGRILDLSRNQTYDWRLDRD